MTDFYLLISASAQSYHKDTHSNFNSSSQYTLRTLYNISINHSNNILPEFPTAKQNERVLVAASRHKEVVFITYCNTRPYLGTDCLTRRVEAVINSLVVSNKVSAVLHFGNPFALKTIRHVPRKLFGYMMPQSQLYAIEALAGKLPAKGKLPYAVEFQ